MPLNSPRLKTLGLGGTEGRFNALLASSIIVRCEAIRIPQFLKFGSTLPAVTANSPMELGRLAGG